MKKSILFRLFGLGSIPKKLRIVFYEEGVIIADEGISGLFITNNVKAPGKAYINRVEGFLGCLLITKKRIISFSFWKRQINIKVDDPNISKLYVGILKHETLSISFESSDFRDGWNGIIEFRFYTEKAQLFYDILISMGAKEQSPKN